MASSLPKPEGKAYFMADSWYSCAEIIDSCLENGWHYIGALRVNRAVFPGGLKISISEFAKTLDISDFSLVKAKKSEYYVYRYEGKLNGIESAAVLLPYPKESFGKPTSLRAFICTDASLDIETILAYYGNRWYIETFFSQAKDSLGFGKHQIRSIKGMERLWTPAPLCRSVCRAAAGAYMPFGAGLRKLRNENAGNRIKSIYERRRSGESLEAVLSDFRGGPASLAAAQ
jgi:hypothetical protein